MSEPTHGDRLATAVEMAQYDVTRDASAVVDHARGLISRLESLVDRVRANPEGATVNELGEIQGQAVQVDTACARLVARREALRMLRYVAVTEEDG